MPKPFPAFAFWCGTLLVYLAWAFLLYKNSLHSDFQFDDIPAIVENTSLTQFNGILDLCQGNRITRCIPYLSFAANYAVGQLNTTGYHAVNVLLHALNSFLAALLAFLTLTLSPSREKKPLRDLHWAGFFAGLIFLSHPLQTQAVTYIWQRVTLWGTFFYLSCLLFYIWGRIQTQSRFFIFSAIALLMGFFSKEIIATAPLTLLVYEKTFFDFKKDPVSKKTFGFFSIFLILCLFILPFKILSNHEHIFYFSSHWYNGRWTASGWDYIWTQLISINTYLHLLFFPFKQSFDYYFTFSHSFFDPRTFHGFLLLLVIAAAIYAGYKRNGPAKTLAFFALWFFISLSVESSFVFLRDVFFEHRLYLPLASFSILGIIWIFPFRFKTLFLVLYVLLLGTLTIQRNTVWENKFTLWQNVLEKFPDNPRAYHNLGSASFETAERSLIHNEKQTFYYQAIYYYEKAVSLGIENSLTYSNLGSAYEKTGNIKKAFLNLEKAWAINRKNPEALYNLGTLYAQRGDFTKAKDYFFKVLHFSSAHLDTLINLSIIANRERDFDSEDKFSAKALSLYPHSLQALVNRAAFYENRGNIEEAINLYKKILTLFPKDSTAQMAIKRLTSMATASSGEIIL